jgi:hypothetical protein
MKRFYTAKERPIDSVIKEFPNDGTFSFQQGSEMFFFFLDHGNYREKDVDERAVILPKLMSEYNYIGVDVDYIGGKMLQLPVFEKKSTALDDYERAMGIIGKR